MDKWNKIMYTLQLTAIEDFAISIRREISRIQWDSKFDSISESYDYNKGYEAGLRVAKKILEVYLEELRNGEQNESI